MLFSLIKLLASLLSLIFRFCSDVQVLLILSGTWSNLETTSPIGPGPFSLIILMCFP